MRLVALAGLLYGPVVAMAFWAAGTYSTRSVVALLLTATLVAALASGITRSWRRFFLLQFPLFVLGVAFIAYTFGFGMVPGRTLAMILVGTSWEEVRGFAALPQGRSLVLLLAASSALYLYLALTLAPLPIFVGRGRRVARPLLVLLLPVTAYVGWNAEQLIDGIALTPAVGSVMFLAGTVPQAAREVRGSRVQKIPYHASGSGAEEVHVLVVGESARRESWSVYGYRRQTTPYLETLRGEAVFLTNAIADANLTEWAVPMLLTGMAPGNFSADQIRGNIVDLAKEGGYTTTWLLNQDIGISTSVGITPDRLEYPADFQATINGRHTLDEALLPAYRRELARSGTARFIGIHMMGSHWEYYRRYPDRFARFGAASQLGMLSIFLADDASARKVLDSYDNTVLYTDWFLQQVIEAARALEVPATVTFFPDHGEDLQLLDGASGHGQPVYTRHAFEIPAFVWMNAAYRRAHPERAAALERNAALEIRTHNVFYTLGDLMGITWPGSHARFSFASEQFAPDVAMQHIAGGVLVSRP